MKKEEISTIKEQAEQGQPIAKALIKLVEKEFDYPSQKEFSLEFEKERLENRAKAIKLIKELKKEMPKISYKQILDPYFDMMKGLKFKNKRSKKISTVRNTLQEFQYEYVVFENGTKCLISDLSKKYLPLPSNEQKIENYLKNIAPLQYDKKALLKVLEDLEK